MKTKNRNRNKYRYKNEAIGEELEKLASLVIKKLKEHGLTIQRYDSITTNSIYLKLDCGVANSIRISDHRGKKHLAYRYNLMIGLKEQYSERAGEYNKYYYPIEDTDKMINAILWNRQIRIEQYGKDRYEGFMKSNLKENKHSKGFWSKAKFV